MQTPTEQTYFADQHAAVGAPSDLLTTAGVKAALGGVSDMSIWRWTRDLGFPAPDLLIARRKFWRRSTIEAWLTAMGAKRGGGGAT